MKLEEKLLTRSENKCELCNTQTSLSIYKVPYAPHKDEDGCVLICQTCLSQLEKKSSIG